VAKAAKKIALIYTEYPGVEAFVGRIKKNLTDAGVKDIAVIVGAAANAPRRNLLRIANELKASGRDGGQLRRRQHNRRGEGCGGPADLGGGVDEYFGTNMVTEALKKAGKSLKPHMAIQTAAGTGAHLTKYSNITDYKSGQKKLIVDNAIVPQYPVFDSR
jgi:alcohol dehydrogenase